MTFLCALMINLLNYMFVLTNLGVSSQDIPEVLNFRHFFDWQVVTQSLDDGIAVTCAFNRKGTMLAVGCNDGRGWQTDSTLIVQS